MIHRRFTKLYYEHEHIKIFILLGLIVLILMLIKINNLQEKINIIVPARLGVSYSPAYTKALGLDPKKTYQIILEDLQVKYLRLPAYWNEIEKEEGKFDFTDLDYYIDEAQKHQVRVILAIGYKLPRWPECRSPGWLNLDNEKVRQRKQLEMLEAVIEHFNDNPTVSTWQVENEPLLPFGLCPPTDRKFLKEEIEFVRTKTQKPILLTDSGELRSWVTPMRLSDYFGTTLYRTVQNKWIGRFDYPFQPWFYRLKGLVVKSIFAPGNQKILITELQAEPWTTEFIVNVPAEEQINSFSLQQFQNNVNFARRVGFEEIYLWGVEWWYWMKFQDHPEYWEYAKSIFNTY